MLGQVSVGVIGQGFVGGTLTSVLSEHKVNVYAYDKAGKYAIGAKYFNNIRPKSVRDLVDKCENLLNNFSNIYFICVPTPMYEDGEADLSIVEEVLNSIAEHGKEKIAVIKSTVPPGSIDKWNKQYNNSGLTVIFNPEFLTEANALEDMRNQTRIILGGPYPAVKQVEQLYRLAFPLVPIKITEDAATAEMVKYITNLHLAVRVILSCELYQICEALNNNKINISYTEAVELAQLDPRLGNSHMSVPGKDGIMGARGHCFPKDMNAIISLAKNIGVNPKVLEAAWSKNLEITPIENRDWEFMLGRAVSTK